MTDFERTRSFFSLPQDVVYLDGNSLGPLPRSLQSAMSRFLRDEWGELLIRGWNDAGWMSLPTRVGDRIAPLIGAPKGSVTCGDTLSIKLFQALAAAVSLRPGRRVVLTDSGNFPSDLYVADGLLRTLGDGWRMEIVPPEDVVSALDDNVAALMLTEVDFRTGRRHDMRSLVAAAHKVGALTVWDLAHTAGAVPVHVAASGADFAVGCTYKYLNGGPGAPAFIYVAEEHSQTARTPLQGWFGHEAPFEFSPAYRPRAGIERMRIGTPAILGLYALDTALDVWKFATIEDVHRESVKLTQLFISGVESVSKDLKLVSPRDPSQRGSQVSFSHPDGFSIMRGLVENGVIGDFRDPDTLRFGFAPLYNTEHDVEVAVDRLTEVMAGKPWENSRYRQRGAVT